MKPIGGYFLITRDDLSWPPSNMVEGVGRIRVWDETLTLPRHGGLLVGRRELRQVFNDTETETLWLITGAPEKELGTGESLDLNLVYPVDPRATPEQVGGVIWPPKEFSKGENL